MKENISVADTDLPISSKLLSAFLKHPNVITSEIVGYTLRTYLAVIYIKGDLVNEHGSRFEELLRNDRMTQEVTCELMNSKRIPLSKSNREQYKRVCQILISLPVSKKYA